MSYVIINRDFWPNAAAIGEGLLCLVRRLSKTDKVTVITMCSQNLSRLNSSDISEESNISFSIARPFSNSSSSILIRIVELIYFSFWVLISLLKLNPTRVYFATNPPLLVPFVGAVYCKVFKKKYIYHIQDIHPEATSLLVKIPMIVFSTLQSIDTWVLKNAYHIVTLTEDMKATLRKRGLRKNNITLIENPSIVLGSDLPVKIPGIVFSGNAGRLQLMEIVLEAIEQHLKTGGKLKFCFVGAGVYKQNLLDLSNRYHNFTYEGYVDSETALKITSSYRWAFLPIMPEVLSYAYPSKITAYVAAGCEIISVTSHESSLAKLVETTISGKNIRPSVEALTEHFKSLEAKVHQEPEFSHSMSFSTPKFFATNLYKILKDIN